MVAEFDLIDRYFRPLAAQGGFGQRLQDDCAHLPRAALTGDLVLTVDSLIEGVHFLPNDPPETIGRKALRVNLSDLAAKGVRPLGCLLALNLPSGADTRKSEAWIAAFAAGLAEDLQRYDLQLLGGDTTSGPGPLSLSITALGQPKGAAATQPAMLRSGAKAGDCLCVSGAIGWGHLGLQVLQGAGLELPDAIRDAAIQHYRMPEPRLDFGEALRASGWVTACMDISDGLVADARHLAGASGLACQLDLERIPLAWHPAAELQVDPMAQQVAQITGGDDYQLLFSCARDKAEALLADLGQGAIIGRLTQGQGLTLLDAKGQALSLAQEGYVHAKL